MRGKRRRGGQFGHRQHLRPSFPPDQVDHLPPIFEWTGEPLGPEWIATDELRTIQQVELAEKLVEVTEHRARLYRSSATGESTRTAGCWSGTWMGMLSEFAAVVLNPAAVRGRCVWEWRRAGVVARTCRGSRPTVFCRISRPSRSAPILT